MKKIKLIVLIFLFFGIACKETEEMLLAETAVDTSKDQLLTYNSMSDFTDDVYSNVISVNFDDNNRYSYFDHLTKLRDRIDREDFTSVDEFVEFVLANNLYLRLDTAANGEVSVLEVLKDSNLSHYLDAKGRLEINGDIYELSPDDLALKPSVLSGKHNSEFEAIPLDNCLVGGSLGCDIVALDDDDWRKYQCPQSSYTYPNELGCPVTEDHTWQNGNKRIKVDAYRDTYFCSVRAVWHAQSQKRFLGLWLSHKRNLRGYGAQKTKYINWNGEERETWNETGIIERNTAYMTLRVTAVPKSQCYLTASSAKCYTAINSHYQVDGYYYWFTDDNVGYEVVTCDRSDVCLDGFCPAAEETGGTSGNGCSEDCGPYASCVNGICFPHDDIWL